MTKKKRSKKPSKKKSTRKKPTKKPSKKKAMSKKPTKKRAVLRSISPGRILEHHMKELRESGITAEMAQDAGMESVDAARANSRPYATPGACSEWTTASLASCT
jgi:hypothetical protein